jgi:hypothetical protein
MKTSIRIEVPDSLYEQLIFKQEKQRQSSGHKPSLASLILDFCKDGLVGKKSPDENVHPEQNNIQKNVRREQKNVQNNVHAEQNANILMPDASIEKRLKHWEEHLSRWETSLREKEALLKEKEDDLFEQKEEVFQMKVDLLEHKDKFRQETLAGPDKIIENRMMSYDLDHKNKKIAELEESLREAKLNYHKAQKLAESQKEKDNTSTIWDDIKKYWPAILAGLGIIGAYLVNRKKDKTKLDPHLGKIAEILEQLDPKGKESLGKAMLDFVENFKKEKSNEKKNDQ